MKSSSIKNRPNLERDTGAHIVGERQLEDGRSVSTVHISRAAKVLNFGKTHGRKPSGKESSFKLHKPENEFSYKGNPNSTYLAEFGMELYRWDITNGKRRLSEIRATTIRSFLGFTKGEDILIGNLDADFISRYEEYLQSERGLTRNTSSFYLRNLRAIYKTAVKCLGIEDQSPFKGVYTGVDKTEKRALGIDMIRKINSLDLSDSPSLAFARDMFMMSFMLRGMSFVDLSFLKVTDLRKGVLHYSRRKTGQNLSIKWETPMQKILDRWPNQSGNGYLLPIIVKRDVDEIRQYRTELFKVNNNLKTIGRMMGTDIPLTLYVARHSWATIAKGKGIPINVISEGMGHSSEATTMVYLGSMSQDQIDSANRKILRML